jgi:hypothetical protein
MRIERQNLNYMQLVQRIASKAEKLFDRDNDAKEAKDVSKLPTKPSNRMRWSALKTNRRCKAERKSHNDDKNFTMDEPGEMIETSPHN